ncbi:Putative ribonuclease H protein At1g65750 [Linum perenne]
MLLGTRLAIRNGRDALFWTSRWVDSGIRLIDSATGDEADLNLADTIADFVSEDGQWDVAKLTRMLPPSSVEIVMGMSPPRADGGEDKWVWGGEDNGCFTIKSAYRIVNCSNSSSDPEPWCAIWNWKGQHRVRMFLWLAIQDSILTNGNRVRRHIATDASCGLCRHQEESTTHVLRDCVFAAESWRRLGGFDTSSNHWNGDLVTWMKKHLRAGDKSLLFGVHCWILWKSRNERVFSSTSISPVSVAHRSAIWTDQVLTSMGVKRAQITSNVDRRMTNVKWSPGPRGWQTLNVDGSVDRQSGRTAAGGLLRDHSGRCDLAFTMNLGVCTITRAEMRGAIEGLGRAWNEGARKVNLQMDSRAAIALLVNGNDTTNQHALETLQFNELLSRNWDVRIEHIYREGNGAADFLAGIGYGYPFGSHTFDYSDSRLGYFLRYDCFGIALPRLISIND